MNVSDVGRDQEIVVARVRPNRAVRGSLHIERPNLHGSEVVIRIRRTDFPDRGG